MNTTDVLVVHAGYAKYRRELLQAGVELFELKLRAGQPTGRRNSSRWGCPARRCMRKPSPSMISGYLSVRSILIRARRT